MIKAKYFVGVTKISICYTQWQRLLSLQEVSGLNLLFRQLFV